MISVMQPYFVPYGGYFQLTAHADHFVIFDCVQFPRRGWVHRNQLPRADGELDWFTVPLHKPPYTARIDELRLAPDAADRLMAQAARFPSLRDGVKRGDALALAVVNPATDCFVDYTENLIRLICARLGFSPRISRSSALSIPEDRHAQDRILDIVHRLGGTEYLNASGGRALYDPAAFRKAGIDLYFLQPYAGPVCSMLHRLLTEPAADIAHEIAAPPPLKAAAA